jgi:hypothetical protein
MADTKYGSETDAIDSPQITKSFLPTPLHLDECIKLLALLLVASSGANFEISSKFKIIQ